MKYRIVSNKIRKKMYAEYKFSVMEFNFISAIEYGTVAPVVNLVSHNVVHNQNNRTGAPITLAMIKCLRKKW